MTDKDYEQAAPPVEAPARDPLRRRAARRLLRAEVIYVTVMAVFAVLAGLAHFNTYFAWDLIISRALQSLNSPLMFAFMRGVSLFGDKLVPWTLAGLTIIVFLATGRRSEGAGLLLSTGGGQLLNSLLKRLIARPRPSNELVDVFRSLTTQSFPSGHVTFYVCYFGFLFFASYALLPRGSFVRRLALTLTGLPILLVGVSRVTWASTGLATPSARTCRAGCGWPSLCTCIASGRSARPFTLALRPQRN